MRGKIIESVPNISEGRRTDVVADVVRAVGGPGRRVIDYSLDKDHNRSVITILGEPDGLFAGIMNLIEKGVKLIDLRGHTGKHPRMGAVDVVPFIPVRDATIEDCIELARRVGKRTADEYDIPVYLYEEAATCPDRRNLATIRKGEFEGFPEKISDPRWKPDFGRARVHPSAGVVAVGAREFLIAYNINLATTDVQIAKKIAKAVRHSTGGLRYVKAMGLPLEGQGMVQVSMNLTNFRRTPILRVFDMVKNEAARAGVRVVESELVGMAPRQAIYDVAATALQLESLSADKVVEDRIEDIA
ncbi:MAG: glutamate formimidoyltransferase [Candidatus Bipolaricaulota bacterium]|nr:glutamate formimidoyltransferase [Candidatus Bipolaricaulota bacterium]